ncbi:MAG: OpgC domain-containing protein [Pseudomonadota bacterium]
MATVSPSSDYNQSAKTSVAAAGASATVRDPRLDFFRGIAMFIILIAHIPGNEWTRWIPARFGFSDATEIFVFCSGMASAIAFGGSFARRGWGLGTARVAYRLYQVYWAHLGLFFFLAMSLAALDLYGDFEKTYINTLNLGHFFKDPASQIVGLFTLTYVPNYFDILPMYMVVLAMMPIVMALARVSKPGLAALSVLIWLMAQGAFMERLGLGHLHLSLPAEPWSDRQWFFNPFGWQLLFFTGFAFMIGWLRPPPVRKDLVTAAIIVVLLSFFLSHVGYRLFELPALKQMFINITGCNETDFGACNPVFDWRDANRPWFNKTNFGPLHYLHFLSLAYLAWLSVGEGGRYLKSVAAGAAGPVPRALLAVITKVGQQSLVVFIVSMALARFLGLALDIMGRDAASWALVNLSGFVLISFAAYGAAWFKSQPWRSTSTPKG